MASSYSTDLKLELMVTGEDAGTWGDITNTNLVILQQSIAGYSSITLNATTGATLTYSNGLPSDGKNAVLNLTGTITGNVSVTIPATVTQKVYVIRNSTTGAFTVTVKISGQTGVTFSATDKGTKLLYANGTDFVDSNIGKLSNDYTPTLAANLSTNSKNIQVASTYGIIDENSNSQIKFTTTASATNQITIANSATGADPVISATGSDTNVGITLTPKGTGRITANGEAKIFGVLEAVTITTSFLTTFNIDVLTQAVIYDNSTDTSNFTINLRGNSTTALNSVMNTGESVTIAFLNLNGNTSYYNNLIQVDGTTTNVTSIWQGGAPTTGNTSGTDVYTYTAIKTAASTFSVLAALTQFKA